MNNWRQSYSILQAYIAQHPEIEISLNGTCIPQEVRAEFFRLFNEVSADYVRETFPDELKEAAPLGAAFLAAESSAISCLKLKNVIVDQNLRWFLQDPTDGLTRRLFDPVYDLVRGDIDAKGFEQRSSQLVRELVQKYTRQGYIHWTALSLMSLLAPDQAYTVPITDESIETHLSSNDVGQARFNDTASAQARFTQIIPNLFTAELLALDSSHFTPLLVPKIILHSLKLDTNVALRADFHEVSHDAFKLFSNIDTMEWHKIADLKRKFGPHHLWPDICLYLNDNPDELRVASDGSHVLWPDIIVDVIETSGWNKNDSLKIIKRHCEVLQPRLGCFVVCRNVPTETTAHQETPAKTTAAEAGTTPPPDEKLADAGLLGELPANIHLLNVGLDAAVLEPIIAALAKVGSSQAISTG
jgi:hypothetical protein